MANREYVIYSAVEDARSGGEGGYWSNEDGWVDQVSATVFSASEREAGLLPVIGPSCWLDADRAARPRGWRNPSGARYFITDLGDDVELRSGVDPDGKPVVLLDRYGVWGSPFGGKPEVIGMGKDLEQLAYEYGLDAKAINLKEGRPHAAQ